MKKQDAQYRGYVTLLKKELVPAMGCTEPIAIAYAAAQAAARLKEDIKQVDIYASGNIIKNVKSVTVPNTGGRKGIQSAVAIGIIAGDPTLGLEVISHVRTEQIAQMEAFLEKTAVYVHHEQCSCALQVGVRVSGDKHTVLVCIQNEHSNIVRIEEDGRCVLDKEARKDTQEQLDAMQFSMQGIYEFAEIADLADVKEILDRQIQCNTAIAEEGLAHSYGANIGSVLLSTYGDSVQIRARALAAAGSDARMSGCELPVIINSGSGNQGMTCSLPVIAYARELQSSEEQLYRALLISNLSTLYQKKYIGRLSAYCGAVSAGAGAGAGIAYLLGGDYDHICHAIVNALAITSGMICDGAKPSCAAKIATAVDAGIMGCMMYQKGKQFYRGEGIVCRDIEETIMGVGQLARDGMKETDDEIIKLMIQN
ncbi:hypothetical protein HMPREF0981_01953 [Erysipelotrichaceae bacterium 6_1_45]|uniref:L-cysteine desulfidase family protein n=1 Tax=Clostridium innocuum TaxID=1522 RepID=UPI000246DD42|nr:L-serine ammonia-lyase, iron-sulfur-dependent, subunit alpha [[Clostridium] innocuum]EHO28008.1 hypothetical protein HMPREF0981_01953 [Erysipelotrichaceae bacterium 6_1_45]